MKFLRFFSIFLFASLLVMGGCKKSSGDKKTVQTKIVDTTKTMTDTTTAKATTSDTGKIDTVSTKKDVGANRQLSINFTLNTLKDKSFTLHEHKGKVILMDFWATWCPPCRKEIPELIKLNDKFKKKGLLVVGVGLDNPVKLKSFASEYGIDYTILQGTQQVAREYGVQGIPTTYILDKKSRVIKRFVGFYPGMEKEILSVVESALKE